MKEHLVDLLFEQCRHDLLIDQLEDLGFGLDKLRVNNWDIVAAIIGIFPDKEEMNWADVHFDLENPPEEPENSDDYVISYDLLYDEFYELYKVISMESDHMKSKERLFEYLERLYRQAEKRKGLIFNTD
jgi:hypothetical protein